MSFPRVLSTIERKDKEFPINENKINKLHINKQIQELNSKHEIDVDNWQFSFYIYAIILNGIAIAKPGISWGETSTVANRMNNYLNTERSDEIKNSNPFLLYILHFCNERDLKDFENKLKEISREKKLNINGMREQFVLNKFLDEFSELYDEYRLKADLYKAEHMIAKITYINNQATRTFPDIRIDDIVSEDDTVSEDETVLEFPIRNTRRIIRPSIPNLSIEEKALIYLNEARYQSDIMGPYIKEARSKIIFDARRRNGPFKSWNDVYNIPSIKSWMNSVRNICINKVK